jgi:hypothetical protein
MSARALLDSTTAWLARRNQPEGFVWHVLQVRLGHGGGQAAELLQVTGRHGGPG